MQGLAKEEVVKKVLDVRVEKKALGGGGVAAAHIGPSRWYLALNLIN